MTKEIFETASIGMRYWFILVIGFMLFALIYVSVAEFRQRKNVMGEVGKYIGYLEIVGGADDVLGRRIGIMEENMVGSSIHADIVIHKPGIKKNHAMLYRKDGRLMLMPMAKGATKINHRRAERVHEVYTGDILSFGDVDCRLFLKEKDEEDDD